MAIADRIELMRCPGCRRQALAPPAESVRAWQCPYCSRRYRRRRRSTESSGTIPCLNLYSKKPWPPARAARRLLRNLSNVASTLLACYAALLLVLMVTLRALVMLWRIVWELISLPFGFLRLLARELDESPGADSPARRLARLWPGATSAGRSDDHLGVVLAEEAGLGIFIVVNEVAKKLGARVPDEIRITHLPCCGVIEQSACYGLGSSRRALVIGLPLLYVLSIEELRAVLAHELAHLSTGDAALASVISQFLSVLDHKSSQRDRLLHPSEWLGHAAHWAFRFLAAPLSRCQELRADQCSVLLAGSDVVTGLLCKVALVQPIFKEVLCYYHPSVIQDRNLYEFFLETWENLGEGLKKEMQQALIENQPWEPFAPHPSLRTRLERAGRYPPHPEPDERPARRLLRDRRAIEQAMHDYLFAHRPAEHSVFRPALR